MNLFIVCDNALVGNGLRHHLKEKFGDILQIFNFYDSKSCVKKASEAQMIVLDYYLSGRSGEETMKAIRNVNPDTEIIMNSSNDEVVAAICAFLRIDNARVVKKYSYNLDNQFN